jgi:hypothetical protein
MSRSVHVPAGIFDSRPYGFAQVAIVPTPFGNAVHMHEGKAISGALKAMSGDRPPCSTWIGVPSLADDEFLVEVEPSPVFLAQDAHLDRESEAHRAAD